jgi:hypothetical protein
MSFAIRAALIFLRRLHGTGSPEPGNGCAGDTSKRPVVETETSARCSRPWAHVLVLLTQDELGAAHVMLAGVGDQRSLEGGAPVSPE